MSATIPTTPPPYMRAIEATVAFWIRQGADELDNGGRHFACPDNDCHDPGDVLYDVLGFTPEEQVDQCFALTWGVEIGAAMAAVIHAAPFADHTAKAAAIVARYRAIVDEQLEHDREERRLHPDSYPTPAKIFTDQRKAGDDEAGGSVI